MTPKQARRARRAIKEQYADQGKDVQQTMTKAFDRIRKFETVTSAFADLKLDDLEKIPQVEEPTIQNLPEKEEEAAQALVLPEGDGWKSLPTELAENLRQQEVSYVATGKSGQRFLGGTSNDRSPASHTTPFAQRSLEQRSPVGRLGAVYQVRHGNEPAS